MSDFIDGNLKFQGSNDNFNTSVETLYVFDKYIHDGWNTIPADNLTVAYNSYRFFGAKQSSCRVSEMRLIGVEAISDGL